MSGYCRNWYNLNALRIFIIIVFALLWGQPAQSERATIQPTKVELKCGEQQKFTTNANVVWSVNDIPGGNKTFGTIDTDGFYRAPAIVPSPAEVQICAKVKKAANNTLWATVLFEEKKPNYKILSQWGEKVYQPNHFREPHSICLEKDGTILLADMQAARVFRFSQKGKLIGEIGKGSGSKKGYFDKPRDVAVDSIGNIFVSDQKNGRPRIQVFDKEGNFVRDFAAEGSGPGEIIRPHGIACAGQKVVATDVQNHRTNVYEHSGKFIKALKWLDSDTDKLESPHGIGTDPNHDVFISDYLGMVHKFTLDGQHLFSFVNKNHKTGSAFIHSMCCDHWGNVYLMVRGIKGFEGTFEQSEDRTYYIVKYNNHGDFICSVQLPEKDHQNVHAAVDSQGEIFVIFQGSEEMGVKVLGTE